MILQKEIASVALQSKVAKSTTDKDWALGHFLDAIFSIPELREQLIFKRGACLKEVLKQDGAARNYLGIAPAIKPPLAGMAGRIRILNSMFTRL